MLLRSPAWLSVSAPPTAAPQGALAAFRLQALQGMQTRPSSQLRGRKHLVLPAVWKGVFPSTQLQQGLCRRCWGVWHSREVGWGAACRLDAQT